jgi:hypothetical protein
MPTNDKTPTHTAYAFSRQGRKFGKLLECGTGYIDKQNNLAHVFMDRGPITGCAFRSNVITDSGGR